MNFRPAREADLRKLEDLEQAVICAEQPFNHALKSNGARYYDLPALISSNDSLLLVVELDEEIISTGYVQIRESKQSLKHERHGYLGFMFVQPQYRGRGINKQVIEYLIEWAKDQGIYDFYLDVYANNHAAINAYKKLGFENNLVEMAIHAQ
jgi:ribosomal protein S18 acetylase RimI-like enzyme